LIQKVLPFVLFIGDLSVIFVPNAMQKYLMSVVSLLKNIEEVAKFIVGYAMLPTASVSGWYFANPDAKYFGVVKINQAQLEDYAKRKGVSIEQAERLLSPNLE
jgi:hypothetical protein